VRTTGALLTLPDAVPCSLTSALLQQLPVDDDGLIHLARARTAARATRAGVKVHRMPVDADEQIDLDGLVVADGPRTFVDLAAKLNLEQLVAVGDVVLRRFTREALTAAVVRRARRPGIVLARQALPLLDPGSASPAETRARLRLHAAGYTELVHGVVIRDQAGGWLAEPDLADEVAKVAVQHDGAVHFEGGLEQRRADLHRDELSRQHGWQVVVSTAIDDRQPHLLLAKVAAAYERATRLRAS
jgi:very-short-patch-repair endonuclease